jgi:hypothetical protein
MESSDSFEIGDHVELGEFSKHPKYDGRIGIIEGPVHEGKWKVELLGDDGELVKVPDYKLQKVNELIISPDVQYFLKDGAPEWISKHLQKFHGVETTSGSNKENHSEPPPLVPRSGGNEDVEGFYARLASKPLCVADGCDTIVVSHGAAGLCSNCNCQLKAMLAEVSVQLLFVQRKKKQDELRQLRNLGKGDENLILRLYNILADEDFQDFGLLKDLNGLWVVPQDDEDDQGDEDDVGKETPLQLLVRLIAWGGVKDVNQFINKAADYGFELHTKCLSDYYGDDGKLIANNDGRQGIVLLRGNLSFKEYEVPFTGSSEKRKEYHRNNRAGHKKRKTSENAKECGGEVVFTASQEENIAFVKAFAAEKGGSSNKPIALPEWNKGTPRGKRVRRFYYDQLRNAKEGATCGEKTKKKAKYILKLYKELGFNV